MAFAPSPATEDLAAFLQGLAPGAHVAVDLRGLQVETALQISRRIADTRRERFLVVGRGGDVATPVAPSLGRALPLAGFAPSQGAAWVVVDAAASVQAGGAHEHARAERDVGVAVVSKLTVVCLYTEDAIQKVSPRNVHDLHGAVAAPGMV